MEPFLGQIQIFPFQFAPVGWLPCNGQLLPIADNTALFDLIGITYGGDGSSTFALPTLPPLTPSGPYYCIAVEGIFPNRPPAA